MIAWKKKIVQFFERIAQNQPFNSVPMGKILKNTCVELISSKVTGLKDATLLKYEIICMYFSMIVPSF